MFSTIQTQTPPDVIDLGRGDPSLANLPLNLIYESARARLSASDNSFLQYGTEQGDGHFRNALANFLTRDYDFSVLPENLFITNGISNALDLICTLFTQAGDSILVEEPSYFLALDIFADHHLNVVTVDTDEYGLIPASVMDKLSGSRPKFLYLIPTFHNPSGQTLTQERREQLIEIAREHDLMIVADEVYHSLNYVTRNFKPFAFYTSEPNIVSLGSFSKILAPGLRLGWLQAHPTIIQRLTSSGLLNSGGGLNPFTSVVIHGLVESGGLEKNIGELRLKYARQVKVMDEALRRHLPEVTFAVPQGGYFFWIHLPDINTRELRKQAHAHKVDFRPGALFSSRGGLENYLRLCFVHYDEAKINEGVLRLKKCIASQ
jgi:DNA-binding transcriptional MocR family regulator